MHQKKQNTDIEPLATKIPMDDHFAAFLEEGLTYVNSWTPTEINEGGCGVFSKLLVEHLTKKGIPSQIFALYYPEGSGITKDSSEGEKNLKDFISNNRNLDKAGEDHVVVKIGELYCDSTGIVNAQVLHATDMVELTKDQLDQVVEKGKWNPEFDKTCTDFISQKLDEIFSKMENFHSGIFIYPKEDEVVYTKHTQRYRKLQSGLGELVSLFSHMNH